MTRSRTISHKIHGIERQVCIGLFMFSLILLGLYVYFVGASVVDVVVRKEVDLRIAEVNSRLSELELDYITKKDTINLEFAQANGFHRISQKTFVNRGTLVGSISYNNESH
ncbi:MAG: hypothetical protein OQJ98_02335 [Candidatus Pacebacteria bacterium]|nr:hypothetical protein [Candidatus Paceibacterota bacterium]